MGEIGLAERHEARVEITPNEKKQEGNGGEILVGDGVDDSEAKVDAKQNFGVGHPPSFIPVFFGDEGIFLAFDLELRRAHKFAFYIENRFEYRSEEHTSELQSLRHLVCRLLLEKKKKNIMLAET